MFNDPEVSTIALKVHSLDYCPARCSVVLALPLRIRPLEVFYAVFVEDPEARGDFVD
jgi:hypothetical protein